MSVAGDADGVREVDPGGVRRGVVEHEEEGGGEGEVGADLGDVHCADTGRISVVVRMRQLCEDKERQERLCGDAERLLLVCFSTKQRVGCVGGCVALSEVCGSRAVGGLSDRLCYLSAGKRGGGAARGGGGARRRV